MIFVRSHWRNGKHVRAYRRHYYLATVKGSSGFKVLVRDLKEKKPDLFSGPLPINIREVERTDDFPGVGMTSGASRISPGRRGLSIEVSKHTKFPQEVLLHEAEHVALRQKGIPFPKTRRSISAEESKVWQKGIDETLKLGLSFPSDRSLRKENVLMERILPRLRMGKASRKIAGIEAHKPDKWAGKAYSRRLNKMVENPPATVLFLEESP